MKRIKYNGNNFDEVKLLFANSEIIDEELRIYTGEEYKGYKFFASCKIGDTIIEENNIIRVEVSNIPTVDVVGLLKSMSPQELEAVKQLLK